MNSQQGARRNAMLAATACAKRRAVREDVNDFLAARMSTDHVADRATEESRPDARHG